MGDSIEITHNSVEVMADINNFTHNLDDFMHDFSEFMGSLNSSESFSKSWMSSIRLIKGV
jgi:hypothetical protein